MIEPFGKKAVSGGVLLFGERVGKVGQQPFDIAGAEQPWHFAHQHCGSPESLNDEAEALKLSGCADEKRGGLAIELDHLGDEEKLARDAAIGKAPLQPLIHE